MSHRIRERTDALDAAGNTTAAIGNVSNFLKFTLAWHTLLIYLLIFIDYLSFSPRPCILFGGCFIDMLEPHDIYLQGFAIGSVALVSLALFGAFVSRALISTVDVLTPKVFIGLLVGAMLPYWFSAMALKSVGSAALKMVEEVRRQFNTIPGLMEGTTKPDYATCVKISTDASIKEMIPPGALVMLTPLIVGIFFGVEILSGVLAGSLISGVQIAISASNTGGAWDNAKKYIEAGAKTSDSTAMEQLDLAFESLKKELLGHLPEVLRKQLFGKSEGVQAPKLSKLPKNGHALSASTSERLEIQNN